VPLDPDGVVGFVRDRAGESLGAGTIYFVPSGDVAALPATTIAVDSLNDEPLEDLIAQNGAAYQKAVIGADGKYAVDSLTAGSYFVTFVPDAADDGHLPGGSACRNAMASTALAGTQLDIEVSSAPSAAAKYVGTGRCVNCHGMTHLAGTMHRLGIWSPYQAGLLQDQSERYTELWAALNGKFTATGTTVYFYNFDGTRGFDKYQTSETDPGAGVSFTVTLLNDAGKYRMRLANVKNPGVGDHTLDVDAVYGGGVWKQRYLVKLTNGSGFYYATLPLQYNQTGKDDPAYGRTSKIWRDYHGSTYYNETTLSFTTPSVSKSFEKNCVSCHATGTRVTGSDSTTWKASLISDPIWGDFDYDGDGIKDELNMGCETCHGPGSDHWASAGQGKAIVSPSLLTPEREAMICGQCHSRPKGAFNTDSPVNAAGDMMRAGTSRADFLADHATSQLDGAASDFFADEDKHSKSHHQQYSDFIRSGMYKNGSLLMTCSNCHDPHDNQNPRQLRVDPTDQTALCGNCHQSQAADKAAHITAMLGTSMGVYMGSATCTQCHMSKTSKSGAGNPGILIGTTQYWTGDISSHLFAVPRKSASLKTAPGFDMPTPYTLTCGSMCHTALP
jgi:predicted CXXCH cytochrome family protein